MHNNFAAIFSLGMRILEFFKEHFRVNVNLIDNQFYFVSRLDVDFIEEQINLKENDLE